MFDLFRSREKRTKYLLGGVLGIVALSLVITLIPGYGTTTGDSLQVLAKVGNDQITMTQVQQLINNAMRSRQMQRDQLQFIVPELLDSMIAERAVAYQAERMGFTVTEDELATALRSMLTQLFPTGEFDRQVYERFLAQQGLTVAEFERNIRSNLLLLKLQNIVLEGTVVTPQEVSEAFHAKNDKVKVAYVKYTPGDLRSQVNVAPDEVRKYYESAKTRYMTPERRSFHFLIADETKIGASVQSDDASLRAAYNANIDRYRTPERVHARHILIKTQEKPAAEVPKLEAKANEILKRIKAGGDFAEIAKKESEDPGSGQNGGDLNWLTRGQTVAPFEQAMFALKPNEISNLVKTEFGFHIIQVLEKENARVKPFEEVREQLATEGKRDVIYQRMQTAMDQARAELGRNPDNAAAIATKFGLTYQRVDRYEPGGMIPEIGSSPEVASAVGTLRPREVSQPAQVGEGKLAIASLISVEPSKFAEFAEVETRVREELVNIKVQQLTQQRITEMRTKFQTATDLDALAKSLGLEVKTTDFFARETTVEGIGPSGYLAEAFGKPAGTLVAPFNIGSDLFAAKVVERQIADEAALAKEREQLMSTIKRQKATQRKELFEDGLLNRLTQDGTVKRNEENIKRFLATFTT